jgi:anthranilate phosphoribosyltransferase
MQAIIEQLLSGTDLSESQAHDALNRIVNDDVGDVLIAGFLIALRAKGETAAEVRGLAMALRERAIAFDVSRDGAPLVDTAGTGGDGSHSLNLSTASALLAAASGARVVKHGNRAISSRSGSADVLQALGLQLATEPVEAAASFERTGFTFLFAPNHHPAMKVVATARRALGVRTVFNILGPLVNPVQPEHQVVGAATPEVARLLADALAGMGLKRAFVVHGALGWDEATPVGPYLLLDVRDGQVQEYTRDPLDVGIARCEASSLRGADAAYNAHRIGQMLQGREIGAHRDAALLGAGLALEVCGVATDLQDGVDRARAALDDGRAARLLKRLSEVHDA